ncbi:MAG TPA: hypothetical protein VG796_24860 [Verrucomicrobiales bacterium]|nr:hypothetical protein [Verrucomicrobiales bacterium]
MKTVALKAVFPIQRADLEKAKGVEEMRLLIELFQDRNHFPDKAIYQQSDSIIKAMLDEYWPLFVLMNQEFPDSLARLYSSSHPGPDAIITHPDGSQTTIQITTCHRSRSESLGRQLLAEGKPVWPARKRDGKKGNVRETGHAFTTREAQVAKVEREVTTALAGKIANYRQGTDALLIFGEMALVDERWKVRVKNSLEGTSGVPYRQIFVCDQRSVHISHLVK